MLMGDHYVNWKPRPIPLCITDRRDPRDSLIGHCSQRMPHKVRLAVAGPMEPILADDAVLCTHTSGDSLSLVLTMLKSWEGPASVAVFQDTSSSHSVALQDWIAELAELGLRQVVVSEVGHNKKARTFYDTIYPANLLRQTAVDAAVGRWVLLADPGFVPSAGFYASIGPSAALGRALRMVADTTPTAFLVSSFVLMGEEEPTALGLSDLRELVDAGEAVSFDSRVCSLCRSYAWQWLLLAEPTSTRFQAVEPADLHHPAWLIEREVLPRLPGFMHGLVLPRSGGAKIGWTMLPSGLKASAELLRARRVQMLLLPGAFLHRRELAPLPSHHWEEHNDWLPLHFFFDLLFRRVSSSLPRANWTEVMPRNFLLPGYLAEVLPARGLVGDVVLLKKGSDPSLTLFVMASIVLASEALELLLSSVPWTVLACALGAKDYWQVTMRTLPPFLRTLPPESLVAMVDAYDVVLFPCSRSISEEYAKFGKDIVWGADTSCFPKAEVCKPCTARYPPGHPDLEACSAFPNLNGGVYMGTAPAVAHALEWMAWNGRAGGRDDQENKWHYYNNHPDRVVLDHHQRIFSNFFGRPPEDFHVQNCSVVSKRTGQEICFAHANGGTKFEILPHLLKELESRGCMTLPKKRRKGSYAGISYPKFIWS